MLSIDSLEVFHKPLVRALFVFLALHLAFPGLAEALALFFQDGFLEVLIDGDTDSHRLEVHLLLDAFTIILDLVNSAGLPVAHQLVSHHLETHEIAV